MPRRVTMLLRNKRVAAPLICLFLLTMAVAAQNAPQAPPRSSQPAAAPPQSQAPPPAQTAPQGQAQEPGVEPGGFVFRSDVQEVVLHATVTDDKQHIITDLDRNAFTVLEDGKPQTIKSFHHEDI